jgi:O-antigen ligase/Flp pilus assembly protein TadD
MRDELFSRAGWHVLAALILFAPLIQGGSPRLPTLIVQSAILLLAALWVREWSWKAPCRSLRITLTDGLLALFLFWALFSFLFAPYQHSAGKGLLLLVCYAVLYWWLVFHPSLRGVETALLAVLGQGLLQAALVWHGWEGAAAPRPSGTFHNINFMAGLLAASVVLASGRVIFPSPSPGGKPARRAAWLAAAVLMGGAIFLSGSRGGVLALAVGMAVLLWARKPALAFAGAALGFAGLFLIPNPWVTRLSSLSQVDVYAYSRLSIWKSALKMMLDHPWFGVGLGQFEYFSPRYAFPVESHWAKYGRVAENAHNEYLQVGAETGVMGLAVWLAALALLGAWFLKTTRGRKAVEKRDLVPIVAALAALCAHAAVDFVFHVPPLALLLVLLAAGIRIHGVQGPSWAVEFRVRKGYGICLLALAAILMVFAVRPVVGFRHFLEGVGAPRNLLREKWALEEAPRRNLSPQEAVRSLEKAVAVDPLNAAYHNALGSGYFRMYFTNRQDEELRRKGLYHANYASQLNPENYRYSKSLGEAMESLSGLYGDRGLLEEAGVHYRRVLALTPRNYGIHEKLGFLVETLGDPAEAEVRFRSVVDLEPNYLKGWYNLGIFLSRQGRMAEARDAVERGARAAEVQRNALTDYERKLVDFDPEMFDNWLREYGR